MPGQPFMRRCPAQSPGCLRGVQSPCGLARPNRSRGSKCCKLAQPGLSLRSSAWIFEPRPGCRLVTATAESGTGSGEGSDFDVEAMLQVAAALSDDPERPSYHIMSQKGWLNVRFLPCRVVNRSAISLVGTSSADLVILTYQVWFSLADLSHDCHRTQMARSFTMVCTTCECSASFSSVYDGHVSGCDI